MIASELARPLNNSYNRCDGTHLCSGLTDFGPLKVKGQHDTLNQRGLTALNNASANP